MNYYNTLPYITTCFANLIGYISAKRWGQVNLLLDSYLPEFSACSARTTPRSRCLRADGRCHGRGAWRLRFRIHRAGGRCRSSLLPSLCPRQTLPVQPPRGVVDGVLPLFPPRTRRPRASYSAQGIAGIENVYLCPCSTG